MLDLIGRSPELHYTDRFSVTGGKTEMYPVQGQFPTVCSSAQHHRKEREVSFLSLEQLLSAFKKQQLTRFFFFFSPGKLVAYGKKEVL